MGWQDAPTVSNQGSNAQQPAWASAPVAQQPKEQGFWQSAGTALSQGTLGEQALANARDTLMRTKEGTPQYQAALQNIKDIMAKQQQESQGAGTFGSLAGGAAAGLLNLPNSDMLAKAAQARALANGQSGLQSQVAGGVARAANSINAFLPDMGGLTKNIVTQGGIAGASSAGQQYAESGQVDPLAVAQAAAAGGAFGGIAHYLGDHGQVQPTEQAQVAQPQITPDQIQAQAAEAARQALVQRAQESWQQPELFGSYTSAEHIGYQRQLDQAQQSGQGVMNFETPNEIQSVYGVPQETNQTKLGSNLPTSGETPAMEAQKLGERNVQGPYQQTYGMEPLQDDLFKGTPVGNALEDKMKQAAQEGSDAGKPITKSPLDIVGGKEDRAVNLEDIPGLVQAVKDQNGGIIPDLQSKVADKVMDLHGFLNHENNPFVTSLFDTAASLKADIREEFRKGIYDEQLGGVGRPKMGDTGASAFFKLPRMQQEGIMEALAPFWNKDGPIPFDQLGLNDKQLRAAMELRKALDTSLDITNRERVTSGKDPILKQENYMPRMREGNFFTVGSKNDVLSHFEGFKTKAEALKAARELEAQGQTASVHFKGETPVQQSVARVGKDTYARHQGMIAEARAMDATNVPGYQGYRNPQDMIQALHKYFDQAENNVVGLKLQQMDKLLNKDLPPRMYQKLRDYMDMASGLGSHLDSKSLNSVRDALLKATGGRVNLNQITNGINKYFSWYKVGLSPIHAAVMLTSHPYMMAAHAAFMEQRGMDAGKLMAHSARAGADLFTGNITPKEKGVLNWAQRAGALENSLSLRSIENKLSQPSSKVKNFIQDPFMSGKIDSWGRESYFLGLYNHATKDLGMTDLAAKRIAMKGTKEAFTSMAKEDRATWTQHLGFMTPLASGLSTWDTGLASRMTNYMKLAMSAGADKKTLMPLAIITMGGLLAGGLRGHAATQYADEAVNIWNTIFPEYKKMSPNDLLMEMEHKHPELGAVIHGVPSQVTGLDMTHQLGVPGWLDATPGMNSILGGKEPPAINAAARAGEALFRLGENATGYRTMSEAEKQKYTANILPRFLQEMPKETTTVLNSKDQKLGEISPEDRQLSRLTGIPSLQEKRIKSEDEAVQTRMAQGTALQSKLSNDVVNSMLYGDQKAVGIAMDRYTSALPELQARGINADPALVLKAAVQRMEDKQTTPAQRAMIQKNLQGIIAHLSYGKE